MEKGHLSDGFLEGLGFQPEKNYSGDVVRRNAVITNESSQRAKCLSNLHQRDLRSQVLITNNRKKIEKNQKERNRILEFYKISAEVEEELSKKEEELSYMSFQSFKKDHLKAFVTVRSALTSKIPSKKRKASIAVEGEINIISLSFQLKDVQKCSGS